MPRSVSSYYLRFLGFLLVCYAMIGKGFAYIPVPPMYIGDFCLLLGLLVLLRRGRFGGLLTSLPSVMLALLVALVAARTLWDTRRYGLMAARDSTVVLYGLYSFVVISLLLEQPDRLSLILTKYRRFAWLYGVLAIPIVNLSFLMGKLMPSWPLSGIPAIYVRLGEAAVHLAGAATFALLGMGSAGLFWACIVSLDLIVVSVSRGAMLAAVIAVATAGILSERRLRYLSFLAVATAAFTIAYVAGVNIPLGTGRSIGPAQVVDDVKSLIGYDQTSNLNGTKEWRLNWWHEIIDYTFHGPYFWKGKGFGINLAQDDGFETGDSTDGAPLRSPHDVHMTILARAGVPGLVLWLGSLAAWFGDLARFTILARRRGDRRWANIFIWIACYGAACILDGSFDVALEGPMIGIWFWCIFGFGVAATMIYRAALATPAGDSTMSIPPTE